MAKDLELHEHHDIHKSERDCGSSTVECLTKTRVWQTLMICEVMVGGPQGKRSDPTLMFLADSQQVAMIMVLIPKP